MVVFLRYLRRHRRAAAASGAALIAALALTVAYWPHQHDAVYRPPARARVYTTYTACLLTGPGGTTVNPAAAVWAGLEDASQTTRAQVQYLAVQGPQTSSNADAYIDTLALRGCSLILTAGALPGQGAADRAAALPRLSFVTVGAPSPDKPVTNLTALGATDPATVTTQIDTLVATAARRADPAS